MNRDGMLQLVIVKTHGVGHTAAEEYNWLTQIQNMIFIKHYL